MTIQDLVSAAGGAPETLAAYFAALPLLAWLSGLARPARGIERSVWRYWYSALIYLACCPGMFSVVLTLYGLLFLRQNLLEVNLLVYFVPIAAMGATLALIARRVNLDDVPGFDRLWGLMLLLGSTFAALFLLERTRVWLVFASSGEGLLLLVAGVFAIFKLGSRLVLGKRSQ